MYAITRLLPAHPDSPTPYEKTDKIDSFQQTETTVESHVNVLNAGLTIADEGSGTRLKEEPVKLAVILSNPPTTAGTRTLSRIELLCRLRSFDSFTTANLFSTPTYRSNNVSDAGQVGEPWLAARPAIEAAIDSAGAILLAHGVQEPTGSARRLHRAQIAWLTEQVRERGLPTFVVGDGPRHPSRWQRYTSRTFPGMAFAAALDKAWTQVRTE